MEISGRKICSIFLKNAAFFSMWTRKTLAKILDEMGFFV